MNLALDNVEGDKRLWSPNELRRDLEAVLGSLKNLGFAPKPSSRVDGYFALIKVWEESIGFPNQYVEFVKAHLDTIGEVHDILELARMPEANFRFPLQKLELMFQGPMKAEDESPENSSIQARNIAWELQVASRLGQSGYTVRFNDPPGSDLFCTKFLRLPTYIECKRPFSSKKFNKSLKTAWKQLSRDVQNTGPHWKVMRCVAVELSKVTYDRIEEQTGHRFLVSPNSDLAMGFISQAMATFRKNIEEFWSEASCDYLGGLILRSRITWIDASDNRPTDFCLHQLWANPYANRRVSKDFERLYACLKRNPVTSRGERWPDHHHR